MSRPVAVSCRMYRILMGAFPRRFRDRFGSEIAATFERLAADAWATSGLRGLAGLWIKTFARRHFPGEEALGGRIQAFNRTWEILGVARVGGPAGSAAYMLIMLMSVHAGHGQPIRV